MNNTINTKRGRGRPKGSYKENTASTTIPRVRITPDKLASYKAASDLSGMTFSAWVRAVLDMAILDKSVLDMAKGLEALQVDYNCLKAKHERLINALKRRDALQAEMDKIVEQTGGDISEVERG